MSIALDEAHTRLFGSPMPTFREHAAGPRYREWLAAGGETNSPDPLELVDAHWECRHGRLAHDAWRTLECRCWQSQPPTRQPNSRTPDLIGVLTDAIKEAHVVTQDSLIELARGRGENGIKRGDVAQMFSVTPEDASRALAEAVENGRLRPEGDRAQRRYLPNLTLIAGEPARTSSDPIATAIHELTNHVHANHERMSAVDAEMDRLQAQLKAKADERERHHQECSRIDEAIATLRTLIAPTEAQTAA